MIMACRIALNILCLALQLLPLQVSGVDRDCRSDQACQCGRNYRICSFCLDNTGANNFLLCSLREVRSGINVPECGTSVGKCPYKGYFYSETTGKCYALNRNKLSWNDAQDACKQNTSGAGLIQLTSRTASNFIENFYNHFKPGYNETTWIGLTDSREEGTFRWTALFGFLVWQNWLGGNLSGNSREKNCVQFDPGNGGLPWSPASCSEAKVSLCETDSAQCEPNPCTGDKPVCVDQVNSYRCIPGCTSNECLSSPCSAGLTCRETCTEDLNTGYRRTGYECGAVSTNTTVTTTTIPTTTTTPTIATTPTTTTIPITTTTPITTTIPTTTTTPTANPTTRKTTTTTTIQVPTTDYCQTNPCNNGGTCESLATTFNCSCKDDFQGNTCETPAQGRSPCTSNPCKNNAVCRLTGNTTDEWECACAAGYTGADCDSDINECMSSPCSEVDICTDKVNGYNCGTIPKPAQVVQYAGATNLQPRVGITSLLSVCAILWVYYDQTATIFLFMMQ